MLVLGTVAANIVRFGFVAALAAAFFYYRCARTSSPRLLGWARNSYHLATVALMASASVLLYLILDHQFQYKYVWEYSSTTLPLPLLMSTFYAGQEGSFMLWALYTSVLGTGIIMGGTGHTKRSGGAGSGVGIRSRIHL